MDIIFIKNNTDKVKKNQVQRFAPNYVDEILELDTKANKQIFINEKCNRLKKIISKLTRDKIDCSNVIIDSDISEKLIDLALIDEWDKINLLLNDLPKNNLISLLKQIKEHQKIDTSFIIKRDSLIGKLGNILHEFVPISEDEKDNKIVTTYNSLTECHGSLKHYELCDKLDILDAKKGSAIAGHRGYFLKGLGVKLNMALMMYAMDFLNDLGYQSISVPHFIDKEIMEKICQLEDFDDVLYNVTEDKYLIATSEQPLTYYYANHIFGNADLPVKFAGISTCYRKEAGAHGKDVRGIFRVHQFEKVEQLCIVQPDKSWDMFFSMISTACKFYESLGLSYRVVNIVSKELNTPASMKYDLEGYFPATKKYRELVSCTNCTDYFSRILNIKNGSKYVHMLNSTLCANTRTICCILETYQTSEGVIIPDVLKPYMGGIDFIPFKL